MSILTEPTNPNQLLRATRRQHNLTLDEIADLLGNSTQRIGQWEKGDPIPLNRIQAWTHNAELPGWVRKMALQMWFISLAQAQAQFEAQLKDLQLGLQEIAALTTDR